jgi:import inner membrane translocase subunit TIM9
MAELTADQQVLQFKDFLSTYNKVTEGCFMNCVNDFKSRTLTNDEVACSDKCVDKFLKMTQRISQRLQEHLQLQQSMPIQPDMMPKQ